MIHHGAVIAFAMRKGAQEIRNTRAEINGKTENGPQLDNNRVHLPVSIGKIKAQQCFRDAQMGGGTHRQEFSKTFDNS